MAEFLQEYELSIWEDITPSLSDTKVADGTADSNNGPGIFEERKLTVIGSHNLHSPTSAYNVSLKENVNGEKTLTFSLPRIYRDRNGQSIENPFLSFLSAERKLKLRDGKDEVTATIEGGDVITNAADEEQESKWYDFVIKNIDEDRNGQVNTYTCKELYVNELGKNGYALVLDSELENNYGTLSELAGRVLEDTDWKLANNSYEPFESVYEPLFVASSNEELTATPVLDTAEDAIPIAAGKPFGVPYSQMKWDDTANNNEGAWTISGKVQIIYLDGKALSEWPLDENRRYVDEDGSKHYYIEVVANNGIRLEPTGMQGGRIVESIRTAYEPVKKVYAQQYTTTNNHPELDNGKEVYRYVETKILVPEMVSNHVVGSADFTSLVGWADFPNNQEPWGAPNSYVADPTQVLYTMESIYENDLLVGFREPAAIVDEYGNVTVGEHIRNYFRPESGHYYCNRMSSYKKFPVEGKKFVFRVKGKVVIPGVEKDGLKEMITIGPITDDEENTTYDLIAQLGYMSTADKYIELATSLSIENGDYVFVLDKNPDAQNDYKYLALKILAPDLSSDVYIESLQLFDYYTDSDGKIIGPEDTPNPQVIEEVSYYTTDNGEARELIADDQYYSPVKTDGCASVRHIDIKESSYFNTLNSLAELFGVWIKYTIKHRKNGILFRDREGNLVKEVCFSRYAPNDRMNWAGFRYGVNMKSLKRTVESGAVASKLIVKDNTNEFAPDGICSIRRAHDNPSGDNLVFNFDYYIAHGMLDQNTVLCDMYGLTSKDFAYLRKAKELNTQLLDLNDKIVSTTRLLKDAEDMIENLDIAISNATSEYQRYAERYKSAVETFWDDKAKEYTDPGIVAARKAEMLTVLASRNAFEADREKHVGARDEYERRLNEYGTDIVPYQAKKQDLDRKFQIKYSRFLQEATWMDDKYVDEDLYYYDALTVSYQNAWPKTKYTLGVVDIEGVRNFSAYKFNIGERSYIEDPEFFGYTDVVVDSNVSVRTPVKKEVVVTERTRNFDDPSKSSITIQTFKNEFDELFSKLTATTQSLQYASGGYQRAADAIQSDGSVAIESIEQAFANNAFMLANATSQGVSWDSGRGIEIVDAKNPMGILRLTNAGLTATQDGGKTWTVGVSAWGINTSMLTAGQINAENINIVSSMKNGYAFAWTEKGLTANSSTKPDSFVRFNEYGIFGTNQRTALENALASIASDDPNKENLALDEIRKYSNFSLTWEGLLLNYQNGATSLSAENGLEIFNPEWKFGDYLGIGKPQDPTGARYTDKDLIPLVSLGRYYVSPEEGIRVGLGDDENAQVAYGLRMRNASGEPTLETSAETGDLWLRNSLTLGNAAAGLSGKLFEDDENTDGNERDKSVVIWAGGAKDDASFSVTYGGLLTAQNADIIGKIEATEGVISGTLKVGSDDEKAAYLNCLVDDVYYPFYSASKDKTSIFSVDYDGKMSVSGAKVAGEITAESGSIGYLTFSNNSFIGRADDNSTFLFGLNDGSYYIDTMGTSYGSEAHFSHVGGTTKGVKENYLIHLGGNYAFLAKNRNNEDVFSIDMAGNTNIGGKASLLGDLSVTSGKILVKDGFNNVITIANGAIFNGTNNATASWKIDAGGNAEFNNIKARGKIEAVVFETNRTSAVGGTLLLTPSIYTTENISGIESGTNSEGKKVYSFEVLADAAWDGIGQVMIQTTEKIVLEKVAIEFNSTTVNEQNIYSITFTLVDISSLPEGTQIISTDLNHTYISLKAADTSTGVGGPRIDLMGASGAGDDKGKQYVRIGDLSGIDDITFGKTEENGGGKLSGYGLYAENAYLRGKLYLPNAGITNEGNEKGDVRIWAGANADGRNSAPFRVTHDGSLYASKGIFSGQIIAENSSFSGSISASEIILSHENKNDADFEAESLTIRWQCELRDAENSGHENETDHAIAQFNYDGLELYDGFKIHKKEKENDKDPDSWVIDYDKNNEYLKGAFAAGNAILRNGELSISNLTLSADGLRSESDITLDSGNTNLTGSTTYKYNGDSIMKIETVSDGVIFTFIGTNAGGTSDGDN